jgi:hypothetical protein
MTILCGLGEEKASVVSRAKLYNMICSAYAVVHVVTECSIGDYFREPA